MKKTKISIALVSIMLLFAGIKSTFSQTSKGFEEIKIKTSAHCDACKNKIETAVAYEKGVKSGVVNLTDKVLTVVYNPKKTTPEKLVKVVVDLGYEASLVTSKKKCCDKPSPSCK